MDIPEWLSPHLQKKCPYCGHEIVNNTLLTDRYCSNPSCPEHMAHKIDVLAKRFGIKGFGVAAARTLIRSQNMRFHVDVLPIWFPEKLELPLHEIGEICLIKGHQKKWREYCDGYDTMFEVINSGRLPPDVYEHRIILFQALLYCNVKKRLKGAQFRVMMSGSFEGYRSRKDFIAETNKLYGDYIQLIDVGKRKTDVDFLVKEEYTSDHEKSVIAREYGIPIITPKALQEKIKAYCLYINDRRV